MATDGSGTPVPARRPRRAAGRWIAVGTVLLGAVVVAGVLAAAELWSGMWPRLDQFEVDTVRAEPECPFLTDAELAAVLGPGALSRLGPDPRKPPGVQVCDLAAPPGGGHALVIGELLVLEGPGADEAFDLAWDEAKGRALSQAERDRTIVLRGPRLLAALDVGERALCLNVHEEVRVLAQQGDRVVLIGFDERGTGRRASAEDCPAPASLAVAALD